MKRLNEERIFFILALPSIIGLFGFYLIPYLISIYYAMIDNPVSKNFVGLKNFIDVYENDAFRLGFKNTTVFIFICVPLNIILSLCIALLINTTDKMNNIFRTIFLLPLVIPSGSIVHFWRSIFGINGVINKIFFDQTPINWLDTDFTRVIIIIIFIWKNTGYNMVLFLAGLTQIPKEHYEFISLEGGGKIRRFFSVTIVFLVPTFFLVLIMSIINSFKSFKEIYLLAGEYPHSSIYMLQHFMNNQFMVSNYQKLSSASYIISIIIIIIVFSLFHSQNKLTENF